MSRLAFAYLALPVLIFLGGWLRPGLALVSLVALGLVLRPVFSVLGQGGSDPWPAPRIAGALLLVALLWAACGGAGHLLHANTDWIVRDAVLRDLVVGDWPVAYRLDDGPAHLLRAPIGYYLPAALAGGLVGLRGADLALLAWTAVGVWLCFGLIVRPGDPLARIAGRLAVFIGFSGMDVAGTLLYGGALAPTAHLEWWAGLMQYSSNTTLLFWVPGHALPAWLAAALLLRHWDTAGTARLLPALIALTPIWSPLALLGIAPLAAIAALVRGRRDGWRSLFDPLAAVAACLVFLAQAAYLLADTARLHAGWLWEFVSGPDELIFGYLVFVLFEFGIALRLLLIQDRSVPVIAAGVLLALLPLYVFGPANDLAMRASIAALAVLAIRFGDHLPDLMSPAQRPGTRVALSLVIALGVVTPMTEFARAFTGPGRPPDAVSTVPDVTRGDHYLARVDAIRPDWLIADPAILRSERLHSLPTASPPTGHADPLHR